MVRSTSSLGVGVAVTSDAFERDDLRFGASMGGWASGASSGGGAAPTSTVKPDAPALVRLSESCLSTCGNALRSAWASAHFASWFAGIFAHISFGALPTFRRFSP